MIAKVALPGDGNPQPRCWPCENRGFGSIETLTNIALRRTVKLRDSLLKAATGQANGVADTLLALGDATGAWHQVDAAVKGQQLPPETVAAHTHVRTLTGTFQRVFACLRAAARQQPPSPVNELRYYCASSLASGLIGCVGPHKPDGPAYRGWDPAAEYEEGDQEGSWRCAFAFDHFRSEIRSSGDITAAIDRACAKLTSSNEFEPRWVEEYLRSWVTELAVVETEQAAAGTVQISVPPLNTWGIWTDQEATLFRYVDAIGDDGSLTLTVPAILADQIWCAYREQNAVWLDDPDRGYELRPTADTTEQALAAVRRFWRPGSERLTAVLAQAKLVVA